MADTDSDQHAESNRVMEWWRKLDSLETEATLHLLRTDDPDGIKAVIAGIRERKAALAALLNESRQIRPRSRLLHRTTGP